jgi:hypothetical protein
MKRSLALLLVPCLLAAAPAVWRGTAAGQPLVLSADDLRLGSAGSLKQAFWTGLGAPDGRKEEHEASWQLLSVVGPLVSVESHVSGDAEGAAHPYAEAAIATYDMKRGGKPANLLDYFPPAPLYQALMGDKLVQTALKGKAKPRDLTALLAAIAYYQSADCVWGFGDNLLRHFAFHHIQGNRVAVRFGLSHGCEVARGGLTILAIYLPIPRALAADLAAAQAGRQGFLVPGAPRLTARASRRTP